MYVADMNAGAAPTDYSLTFELYEGVGAGGSLLGRREYTGLTDGFAGFISADFSSVTLQEGQAYTIILVNDTPRWGRVACGNQYGGGTAIYAGAASPTSDALFRVQWQADTTEPMLANDQNDSGWSVTQQIQVGAPIGQSFTAISGNRLADISMYVVDMNAGAAPTDYSLTFELYEGEGAGGSLLGRTEYTGLTDGFSGFITADFSSVTLQEGQVYTIILLNDTQRWGRMACGNQYGGGTAIYAGVPSPTSDALFRVNWHPNPGQLAVMVSNVPPMFEAGSDERSSDGWFTRIFDFTDPGVLDMHTVRVDYGDGMPVEIYPLQQGVRQFEIHHTYTQPGEFTVTVTVSDDDLGAHTDSFRFYYYP